MDVWSAGVVLHTLLAGIYPFCNPLHPNNEQLIMKVLVEFARGHFPYIPPPHVSPECSQLLQRMLTLEPSRRIKVTSPSHDSPRVVGWCGHPRAPTDSGPCCVLI